MTLQEHQQILEALELRDADVAAALMEEHVRRAHRSIISYLRQQAPKTTLSQIETPVAEVIGDRTLAELP